MTTDFFTQDTLDKMASLMSPELAWRHAIEKMPKILQPYGFEFVGYGAYRMAFYSPEHNIVVKFPLTARGQKHNQMEWEVYSSLPTDKKHMFAACLSCNEYYAVYEAAEVKWKYSKRDIRKMQTIHDSLLGQYKKHDLDDLDVSYTRSCLNNFGRMKKGWLKKEIVVIDYPFATQKESAI